MHHDFPYIFFLSRSKQHAWQARLPAPHPRPQPRRSGRPKTQRRRAGTTPKKKAQKKKGDQRDDENINGAPLTRCAHPLPPQQAQCATPRYAHASTPSYARMKRQSDKHGRRQRVGATTALRDTRVQARGERRAGGALSRHENFYRFPLSLPLFTLRRSRDSNPREHPSRGSTRFE